MSAAAKDGAEPTLQMRVRANETDQEIALEVERCANQGVFVSYFANQSQLNQWAIRRATLCG